ncbi:MAG: hypothetical protein L0Y54_06240 [Sporichthyaceae bacterium]|nr:hypothetical protein [Sporichthyaceae bacterium]
MSAAGGGSCARRCGRIALALSAIVATAGLGIGATAPAAAAGDRIDRAAAALRADPFYLAPEVRGVFSQAQVAGISNRLRRAATPIFVAVLPVAATAETGHDPGRLPGALYLATGQRAGTYAVMAGPYFQAGSTELGTLADEIALNAQQAPAGNRAEAILRFIEEVELELWQPPPLGPTTTQETHRPSPGFPYAWLFAALVLGMAGLVVWARAKLAKSEQQELDLSTRLLHEDLRTLGAQVEHARASLTGRSGPGQDAVLSADYARALAGLAEAQLQVGALKQPQDAVELARTLDEARYALACALARVQDQPLPIRPACVFDPLHPAPVTEVLWAPEVAEPRLVPACPADARRLLASATPLARTVTEDDRTVPYWMAGPSCRSWAQGWYGTGYDSDQLYALFAGTPLGAALDDPAVPTAESPLDGWTDSEPARPAGSAPSQTSPEVSR